MTTRPKTPHDLHAFVYEVTRREARQPNSGRLGTHVQFALALPEPRTVSDEDAAAFCSLVIVSPNDGGLETFYDVEVDGSTLGAIVRAQLPDYNEHQERGQVLIESYKARNPRQP